MKATYEKAAWDYHQALLRIRQELERTDPELMTDSEKRAWKVADKAILRSQWATPSHRSRSRNR